MLAQDFHADRALPGDDVRIVVGMDEGEAPLGLELPRMRIRLVEVVAVQHDPAAAARAPPGP